MLTNRLSLRTARRTSRDGFTLVELLVVIGIIAILAGVALGPITGGIEKAKESSGLQTVRSINLLMFSYSNDNGQTFLPGSSASAALGPGGTQITTGHDIANALLNSKYATDASIFAIKAADKYTGSSTTYALQSGNVDFNFVGAGASAGTGVTSSACDQLPIVWSTTGSVFASFPTAAITAGVPITVTSTGAFALNGLAVAYKSNSAVFLKANNNAGTYTAPNFLQASYSDTAQYCQISP